MAREHFKEFWLPNKQCWKEQNSTPGFTQYGCPIQPDISPEDVLAEREPEPNIIEVSKKRNRSQEPQRESQNTNKLDSENTNKLDSEENLSFQDSQSQEKNLEIPIAIDIVTSLGSKDPKTETLRLPTVNDTCALYLSLLVWQTMFKVSSRAMSALFGILWIFLKSFGFDQKPNQFGDPYLPVLKEFTKDIEENILLCSSACPACFKVYRLSETYVQCVNPITRKITRHPAYCEIQNCPTALSRVTKRSTIRPIIPIYYTSIAEQLRRQIKLRPDFVSQCNAWRHRNLPDNVLADVYDGDLWKEWTKKGFFSNPNELNFGFWLNVDWFNTFTRANRSNGVVYLVNLNLPRELRLLESNVITVGVWPDVGEHTFSSTAFMDCIVDQLEELFDGVPLDPSEPQGRTLRAALMFVSADIPAIRATCGLLSVTSTHGCHLCDKKIYQGGSYGNFETDGREQTNPNENKRVPTRSCPRMERITGKDSVGCETKWLETGI